MNPIVKNILFVLLGMVLMYIILKLLSKMPDKSSETSAALTKIALSVQFYNLTKTNEFREIVKMPEFKQFAETLAEDQLRTLSQSLF